MDKHLKESLSALMDEEANELELQRILSTKNKDEINDRNVVKVEVETDLKEDSFLKAKDFFRTKKDLENKKYIKLHRGKIEILNN